jgi:streptogramin lyase
VTLPRSERLARVDLATFRRLAPGPRVGRGSLDVDAGFGALWVTTGSRSKRLTRIDLDTGRRTVTPLPDGTPVAVEVGEDAVWVGIRGARLRAFPRAQVVRIDPRTAAVARQVDVPRGVQDITVGGGAVWVANRAAPSVTRLDVDTGALTTARTGRGPAALTIGDGAVWVANGEESTVSRISRSDPGDTATIGVAGSPRGVAFGGGSLWVTSFASSTLTRIDGESGRATGDPVELALNPTKLTVSRGAVYVVSPAGGELQRVRFAAPR